MQVSPNSYYITNWIKSNPKLRLLLGSRIGQRLPSDLSGYQDFIQGKGWSLAISAILQPFVINSAYPGKTRSDFGSLNVLQELGAGNKKYGEDKMKTFKCEDCGKKCYSASSVGAKCPYCGGEIREVEREGVKK